MKKALFLFCIPLLTNAQFFKKDNGLAHTFSIVAIDKEAGEMAVAVQSHWFSVGNVVAWAKTGVGVVATQSFVNKSFGIRGLGLIDNGKTANEAMKILLSDDEGREVRQVAIIDANGGISVHTGNKCIDFAGHIFGDDFSVQSNMMLNSTVPAAMAEAYKSNSNLPLAERVLEALKAAQNAGGDIRGKQSAAIRVVKTHKSNEPWNDDFVVDLRVDDHENPIKEIERLLKVQRAYEFMNEGDLMVEINDMEKAMQAYNAAMQMFPDNLEMKYWTAITLANNGDTKSASKMLQEIYLQDENWRELTRRLPKVGLLNVETSILQSLLK
jgi:uncharacterized Ntn-hydrolase superfamily protein